MLAKFRKWVESIAKLVFWNEVITYDLRKIPNVKVQLDDGAYMPTRAHDTDAGADLYCMEDFIVPAHDSVVIGTGVHIELPEYTVGMVKSKSGLNINACITCEGVVDEGYDGEIRLRVYNHGDYDYAFAAGDKVTQFVVLPVLYPTYIKVTKIDGGARGSDGFGSTGR